MAAREEGPILDNADLMVSAKFIGRQCADANIAFVRCKAKAPNPGACTAEGERVTSCVVGVHKALRERCPEPYNAYKECMFWNNNQFGKCRKLQQALETCWAEGEEQQ